MPPALVSSPWDLTPAIDLLKTLGLSKERETVWVPAFDDGRDESGQNEPSLGNFDKVFEFLEHNKATKERSPDKQFNYTPIIERDVHRLNEKTFPDKVVCWRDQDIGTDLEDRSEPAPYNTAATLRQQRKAAKRAKRKAKAKESLEEKFAGSSSQQPVDSTTDFEESDEELQQLRRSPDRRAIIQSILNPPTNTVRTISPPSSPSPPKASTVSILKRQWPVADPFHYQLNERISARRSQIRIAPIDGLNSKQRKLNLISALSNEFLEERKLLTNSGISDPEFAAVNISNAGIHIFIDISNVSTKTGEMSNLTALDYDWFSRLPEVDPRSAYNRSYTSCTDVLPQFLSHP